MKKYINKYSAPTYYRHFGSIRLNKEELLDIMVNDSVRLKQNGVYYTIYLKDYAIHGCDAHIASIYRNNFTPYHDHDYYEIKYVHSGELLEYIDGRPCVLQDGDMLLMAQTSTMFLFLIKKLDATTSFCQRAYLKTAPLC